jgi:hypothetical protein
MKKIAAPFLFVLLISTSLQARATDSRLVISLKKNLEEKARAIDLVLYDNNEPLNLGRVEVFKNTASVSATDASKALFANFKFIEINGKKSVIKEIRISIPAGRKEIIFNPAYNLLRVRLEYQPLFGGKLIYIGRDLIF